MERQFQMQQSHKSVVPAGLLVARLDIGHMLFAVVGFGLEHYFPYYLYSHFIWERTSHRSLALVNPLY